jgi:hypothetical protein
VVLRRADGRAIREAHDDVPRSADVRRVGQHHTCVTVDARGVAAEAPEQRRKLKLKATVKQSMIL